MRCKSCGYRLRDLEDNRCPECGRAFDPDDESTFLPREEPPLPPGLMIAYVVLISAAIVPALLFIPVDFLLILLPLALLLYAPLAVWLEWRIRNRKARD